MDSLKTNIQTNTSKQLGAQCSNIRKKQLLSQLELEKVQHQCEVAWSLCINNKPL